MTVLEMTLLIWGGSLAAGFFGAMTGLGVGVIIVPMFGKKYICGPRPAYIPFLVKIIFIGYNIKAS